MTFDDFCHASLREYHKLEGYCMFKDGYVLHVETVSYDSTEYAGVKAQVKPRTNDKDPISKKGYYSCWLIMKKSLDGCIQSAYCTCKGGMDGCCRHIVATLFEINDFMQDFERNSCTSKACTWVRRASQADNLGKPVPAADLDTSVLTTSSIQCPRPLYFPLADDTIKPDPEVFFDKLKTLCPLACGLTAKYVCTDQALTHVPLCVATPLDKLSKFMEEHKCCIDTCICVNIFIYYHLCYSDIECDQIEECTRGQSNNPNWHLMRKGLLTASVFHQICCSTNLINTAATLLKGGTLNEQCLPAAIMFGRRYESKARDTFMKAHRFRHRRCTLHVPGLVMCKDTPFLACSPDGIVDCKTCGKFLIEIKCSYKYKCFHPTNALKLSHMCEEDENKNLVLKRSHKYFDQVQGQMAITGVTKCLLVFYTHKGIATVVVDFDEDFWMSSMDKVLKFYREAYFPLLIKQ